MLVPAGKEIGTGGDASASSFSSIFFSWCVLCFSLSVVSFAFP